MKKKRSFEKIKKGILIGLLFFIVAAPAANAAGFGDLPSISCKPIGELYNPFGDNIEIPDALCIVTAAIQTAILAIIFAINWLLANLLEGFSTALLYMIRLGIDILESPAISIGVDYSLKLANILFVVAIIVIAFATILRWHEYEAKKLLPRLIIGALLVNFSLLVAGLFIDIGNVFTNYFVGQVRLHDVGMAISPNTFDSSMRRQRIVESDTSKPLKDATGKPILGVDGKPLYEPILDTNGNPKTTPGSDLVLGDGNGGGYWTGFFILFPRAILGVFMTFVALMAMMAATIMALIRNIWVVILVIVMPLAWALWVLPKYEEYWKSWWRNFLNWAVIYLPTLTFFLFVAVEAGKMPRSATELRTFQTTSGIELIGEEFMGSAIRALITIGLLIGGLKIAQSMGSAVAGAFASLAGSGGRRLAGGLLKTSAAIAGGGAIAASKIVTKPLSWIGSKMRTGPLLEGEKAGIGDKIGRALQGANKMSIKDGMLALTGQGAAANLYGKFAERLSTRMARLSFIPGFGAAASFLGKTSAAQSADIEEAMKEYEGLSPAGRRAKYAAAKYRSPAHRVAAVMKAHENHELDAMHENLVAFAGDVASFNPGAERSKIDLLKAIAGHDPRHAAEILGGGETMESVARKADTATIQSWEEEVYDAVEGFLSNAQKKAYASKDGTAQNRVLAGVVKKLEEVIGKLPEEIAKDFKEVNKGEWKKGGDLMKRVGAHLDTIAKSDDLSKLLGAGQKDDIEFGREVARKITLRTKSKSEHGAHVNGDWRLGRLLRKGFSGRGTKGKAPAAHGDSHSKSDSHGH